MDEEEIINKQDTTNTEKKSIKEQKQEFIMKEWNTRQRHTNIQTDRHTH